MSCNGAITALPVFSVRTIIGCISTVWAKHVSAMGHALHAYVLMTNHVHLLMTPTIEESISRVIQSVGRRYVRYINHTYRRTGTLWEGRHKGVLPRFHGQLS